VIVSYHAAPDGRPQIVVGIVEDTLKRLAENDEGLRVQVRGQTADGERVTVAYVVVFVGESDSALELALRNGGWLAEGAEIEDRRGEA